MKRCTNLTCFSCCFSDSICFLSKPGYPEPTQGSNLGDLSDQLQEDYGPNSFCTEFVSGGAKNYSMKIAVGGNPDDIKTVTKVRGISINCTSDSTVTFDNLKEMVLSESPQAKKIDIPSQLVRLKGWRIISRPSSKTWQVCLNKRRRIGKDCTVPYGFTDTILDEDDYDLLDVLDSLAE
jgi:hypothetical protein